MLRLYGLDKDFRKKGTTWAATARLRHSSLRQLRQGSLTTASHTARNITSHELAAESAMKGFRSCSSQCPGETRPWPPVSTAELVRQWITASSSCVVLAASSKSHSRRFAFRYGQQSVSLALSESLSTDTKSNNPSNNRCKHLKIILLSWIKAQVYLCCHNNR